MGELLQVDEFPAGAVGKSVPRLPCGTGSVWSWIADHAVTWRRVSAGVSPGIRPAGRRASPLRCKPRPRLGDRTASSGSSWPQHAEFVALRVGEHDPSDVALTDIGARRAKTHDAFDLFLLV